MGKNAGVPTGKNTEAGKRREVGPGVELNENAAVKDSS